MTTLRESLRYEPVELAFGTSGLRGLVTDITDLEAYINARGFLAYLLELGPSAGGCAPGATVYLGSDLRPSSDGAERSILRAVATAAVDVGLAPRSLGPVPTPCLTFTGLRAGCASVMITGSHIPFDRNGIKFNRTDGEVLKSDEPGILRAVARVRAAIYAEPAASSAFDDQGRLRPGRAHAPEPGATFAAATEAREAWRARWRAVFPADAFAGRRIVVYQHSAVGRDLLVEVLGDLGAEVVPAGRSESFVPVDTEDIGPAMVATLRDLARAARAGGRVDAVVSTDGDSDRPLVAAVVEDPVAGVDLRVVGGDLLGLLVAEYLEADAVAVPVSANDAVDARIAARGAAIVKTRIGSPHVIAAMSSLRAGAPARRIVAWEANGGFMTGVDLALGGGTLTALPTRDAFLPILAVLHSAFRGGGSLAALIESLPPRYSKAGLIDNFPVAVSRDLIARFALPAPLTDAKFRAGVPVDAPEDARSALVALAADLQPVLASAGLGALERLNTLDGVRAWCAGGEIIHLRPSGNAPQMRVYAVAGSPARASALVAEGIREPDGLLRRLERGIGA